MAKHRRRRPRRRVKCTLCTPFRYGNGRDGQKAKNHSAALQAARQVKEYVA